MLLGFFWLLSLVNAADAKGGENGDRLVQPFKSFKERGSNEQHWDWAFAESSLREENHYVC